VEDYLLKPIKADEMNRSLRSCIEKLDEEAGARQLALEQLLSASRSQRGIAAGQLRTTGVFAEGEGCLPMVVELPWTKDGQAEALEQTARKLADQLQAWNGPGVAQVLALSGPHRQYALLFPVPPGAAPDIAALSDECGRLLPPGCLCAIGAERRLPETIQPDISALSAALSGRPIGSKPILVADIGSQVPSIAPDEEKVKQILYFIEKANHVNAVHEINTLLKDFRKAGRLSRDALTALWARLSPALPRVDGEPAPATDFPALLRLLKIPLEHRDSSEIITDGLSRYVGDRLAGASMQRKDTLRKHIYAAKTHIEKNYTQDIRLRDFARQYFYTEEYFSRLFKSEFQVGFVEYLTQVRMDHALHLMAHAQMKLSDVATLCGYHDYKYFCRLFRQKYGVTPSQMRGSLTGTVRRDDSAQLESSL